METIISSVEGFVGGTLPDDITLLVAKFLPVPAVVDTVLTRP
jgi:hypothetical protein